MVGYRLVREFMRAEDFAESAGITMEVLNKLLESELQHMNRHSNGDIFVDSATLAYFQNDSDIHDLNEIDI